LRSVQVPALVLAWVLVPARVLAWVLVPARVQARELAPVPVLASALALELASASEREPVWELALAAALAQA